MGFVCFPSPYSQFLHCDIAKPCNDVAYYLEDLAITFTAEDNNFTITIPPTVYLMQQAMDTQCVCLISKSNEYEEDLILGTPLFRNNIVLLDFLDGTITLYNKPVNSPIVPTVPDNGGDDSDDKQKLEEGALVGIIFGSIFFVIILGVILYKFALPKKNAASRNGS